MEHTLGDAVSQDFIPNILGGWEVCFQWIEEINAHARVVSEASRFGLGRMAWTRKEVTPLRLCLCLYFGTCSMVL